MVKLVDFFKGSYEELKHKVTWPDFNSLQSSAVLVLVASLIISLIIGAMDFGFDTVMSWFYRNF
jgi:preprotein translocase subunit SecE